MEEVLLGKLVKDKRLSLNLTMDQVAQKSDISRATLSSIEKGSSNCSIKTFLRLMDVLGLSLRIDNQTDIKKRRERASRVNTLLDKKTNRFVINCVEQYASSVDRSSKDVYKEMADKGIIDDLENDYEDLHGMSTIYLNDYIAALLKKGNL